MKRIIPIVAFMLLVSITVSAQTGRIIYNKYSDCEGISAIHISSAMFKMMGRIPFMKVKSGNVDLTPIVKSLTGFYLLDCETNEMSKTLRRDVEQNIVKGVYELLMEIKDEGEITHIYIAGNEEEISSIIFLITDASECTFICLDGKLSRQQLETILSVKKN